MAPYESFKEDLSPAASRQALKKANVWPCVLSPELINTATCPKGGSLLWPGGTGLKLIAFLSPRM